MHIIIIYSCIQMSMYYICCLFSPLLSALPRIEGTNFVGCTQGLSNYLASKGAKVTGKVLGWECMGWNMCHQGNIPMGPWGWWMDWGVTMSSDQQAYAKKMSRAAQVEVTSVDMSGEWIHSKTETVFRSFFRFSIDYWLIVSKVMTSEFQTKLW